MDHVWQSWLIFGNFGPPWTVLDHLWQSWTTVFEHLWLNGTPLDCHGPSSTVLDHLGLYWTTLDCIWPPWTALDFIWLSWTIFDCCSLPWNILDHLELAYKGGWKKRGCLKLWNALNPKCENLYNLELYFNTIDCLGPPWTALDSLWQHLSVLDTQECFEWNVLDHPVIRQP